MHRTNSKTSDRIIMKCLYILFSTCYLIGSGLAKPASPTLTHQDSFGQYSFGYSAPNSARSEVRTLNGETRGVYSYVDDAGVIQSAQYVADSKNGFQVAATNLPEAPIPVQDTQVVSAARKAHLEAHEMVKAVLNNNDKGTKIEEKVVNSNADKEMKIGANNILLKELNSKDKKVIGTEETLPMQKKEEKIQKMEANLKVAQPENAEGEIEVNGKKNCEKDSETVVKESQTILSPKESDVIEEHSASTTILKADQEEMKSRKESQEKDTIIDISQEIISPINILPLNPAYSTLIKYTPLTSFHYIVYNSP